MRISKFTKPILNSKAGHAVISWLLSVYVRFVFKTTKWTRIGFEERDDFCRTHQGNLVLQWHNRAAMVAFAWPVKEYGITLVTSAHRDGRLISHALHYLGIKHIEGSSTRGGSEVLRQIIKAIRSGTNIAMTPDGPTGPRFEVKEGPIAVAKMTGAPVSILTYSMKKRKVLASWDRFILPLPFNEGVLCWRKIDQLPDRPSSDQVEAYRKYAEDELIKLSNEADAMMGHDPVPKQTEAEIKKAKDKSERKTHQALEEQAKRGNA